MRAGKPLPEAADEEDFFDMANLPPEVTGLPMVVWVSQRGRSRHDVRVKVSLIHGKRMNIDQTTSVSVRPSIMVAAGPPLSKGDLEAVSKWIDRNQDTIIDFWEERIYTNELLARLVPLDG
jgi:hypothetical protein